MKKLLLSICLFMLLLSGCGTSHENEARPPKSNSSLKNQNYQDVVTLFEEAGFTNIELDKIEDLITGWLTKDGSVESVSIGGDTDYSTSQWYSKDSKVRISYHTFPENKEQGKETKETMTGYSYKKVNIGEFSFNIPDYWNEQDPYYYAETGDGVTLIFYTIDDSLKFDSFDDIYSVKDSYVEGLGDSVDSFELISNEKVKINGTDAVKMVFTGNVNDVPTNFMGYLLFQPESNDLLAIMMGQTEKSKYDHFSEFEDMMDSIGPKEEALEETKQEEAIEPEPAAEETPVEETKPQEEIKEQKPVETKPATSSGYVDYSSNDKSTYKNGDSGQYAYSASHPLYDSYIIIDFDEGYVYMFQEGDGNTTCDKVAIESGNLNDILIVTYHDGGDSWSYGLHFAWKNQPNHLVLEDNDHFEYDYYPTNLDGALRLKSKKKIYNY